METIYNGAPMHISRGFATETPPQSAPTARAKPIHYPFVWGWAEKGELTPQVCTNDFNQKFGKKTVDVRGKFMTHQTVAVKLLAKRANQFIFQRLIPQDATQSVSVIYCGLSTNTVTDTLAEALLRKGDVAGITEGAQQARRLIMWKRKGITVADGQSLAEAIAALNGKEVTESITVNGTAMEFKFRAIFVDTRTHGEHGNFGGYTIETPDAKSAEPLNIKSAMATGGRLHKIGFWERPSATVSPEIIPTRQGAPKAMFCLKGDAFDTIFKTEMDLKTVLSDSYTQLDRTKPKYPLFAPYQEFTYFEQNYLAILDALKADEDAIYDDGLTSWFISPFTARDINGDDYYSFRLVTAAEVADPEMHRWSAVNVVYGLGGSDGTLTDEAFDQAVAAKVEHFGNEYNLLSRELWPFSIFYDTGFSSDTKALFSTLTQKRRDVAIGWGTHVHGAAEPTILQEQSIARFIKAQAEMVPESNYWGTGFCRGFLMVGSADYTPEKLPFRVSTIFHAMDKLAYYAGNSEGIMKPDRDFSTYPKNRCEVLDNFSNVFRPDEIRVEEWDLGMNSILPHDSGDFYTPGLYTLFDDDRTPLKSVVNMFIGITAEKASRKVWSDYAGVDNMPKSVLKAAIDAAVERELSGRFDGRLVNLEVNTYFTKNDLENGYSWHTAIKLKLAMPHSVGVFDITFARLDEDTALLLAA